MKKITTKINEIIELLLACGFIEKAKWYQEKCKIIKKNKDSINTVEEIRDSLAGMGSFLDLSLNPNKASKITRDAARIRQWELVEELDELINIEIQRKK